MGAELVEARRQLTACAVDGARGLPRAYRSSWPTAVLVIWAIAIVLDAVTTYALLGSPAFEEGNPVAASLMSEAGIGLYIVAVSLVSMMWAVFASATTEGDYARTATWVAALLGVGKLAVAVHNALLWRFG